MSQTATGSWGGWVKNSTVTRAEWIAAGSLLAALVAASCYLLPFWREFPELSHGYFAPFCALALLWQSRGETDLTSNWSSTQVLVAQGGLFVLGLSTAWLSALAALAQGLFHSQTAFLTGMTFSVFVLSGILALSRGPAQLVRLNGASLCATALWWFAVPLPSGTLARFTLLLQDLITAGSVKAVHWFGLPAVRDGNIIKLADALVGVEEACSGIRSLTACLFAGVVLGGLMLRGVPKRIFTVTAAGALAVFSNFFRSIMLCLLAARGVEINGWWHDATAYAVLGVTALVLFAGCLLLSRPKGDTTEKTSSVWSARRPRFATHFLLGGAVVLLLMLVGFKLAPQPASDRPPPDLAQLMALDHQGWLHRTDESIFAFSTALNTTFLRQETYLRNDTQLTFYVAFWSAHQSTLGSVALHTPDICLPGGGWVASSLPPPIAIYPLPDPRRFAFEKDSFPQYVWFWHYFGGRLVGRPSGLYPWQLGPLLLKRTVSARAPQWVIRVSSNKPLESLLGEPIVKEFFVRLHEAGMTADAIE